MRASNPSNPKTSQTQKLYIRDRLDRSKIRQLTAANCLTRNVKPLIVGSSS